MAGARVMVVGSSNTDMIVQVPRLPAPGETILGGRFSVAPGGKGANQAVGAARLGAAVTFIGRVGDDEFGRARLAELAAEGIDTSGVVVDPEVASGVALIFVEESGENAIAVAPGANCRVSVAQVEQAREACRAADVVLLQLEVPLPAVERAIALAQELGKPVILDPAPARTVPDALLAGVDYVTPNETEAETLLGGGVAGLGGVAATAEALLHQGPGCVIITLGKEGALVATTSEQFHIPGRKVEAVDTTAAGDAFAAALAVSLGEGKPLREALRFAVAASALSVTRLGAQPSLPRRAEVDRFLASG
ncbi:MAG: ribokinase [Armatimonadetes bacterium]|nr:ribokinase [Armatimonadota bacterium]